MALSVVLEISQLVEGVAKAEAPEPPEPNDRIIVETEERCITLLLEAAGTWGA